MPYAAVFEAFPSELRLPIARLVDALKAEFAVRRADVEELQAAVRGLAAAQARTEVRIKVVIAPYADESAKAVASRLGIEVCTDVTEFT